LIVTIETAYDPSDLSPAEDEVICCTFVPDPKGDYMLRPAGGGPETPHRAVYFAAPAGTTDVDIAKIAFEIREGKPMEPYQEWCIDEAKRGA
jgi:hypothetical protein